MRLSANNSAMVDRCLRLSYVTRRSWCVLYILLFVSFPVQNPVRITGNKLTFDVIEGITIDICELR